MGEHDDDGAVGYGRPPRHGQFPKGRSGNPSGRPKGSTSLSTDLDAALREKVRVTENGRTTRLTKQKLLVKTTLAKAIKGDTRATAQIFALVGRLLSDTPDTSAQDAKLSPDDQAVLDAYVAEKLGRTNGADNA